MNKILHNLYIGGIRDARNHDLLKANKISFILSIHDTAKSGTVPGVQYLCLNAADLPSQNLAQFFSQCNDFIHSARESGGNVLIHCLAGVSRSVTILVAYLMSITNLTSKQALEAVRTVRNIAEPNPGFKRQLHDFETFKVKQERNRLSSRFPGQIPSKSDENELYRILGHYPTPQPNLTPPSETTGTSSNKPHKFIFFYSPTLPRRVNSSSSIAKEF